MTQCDHNCSSCSQNTCESRIEKEKTNDFSQIKKVVAVLSGKGGVGKSMVTSLLAVELTRAGYKVGILDADITGPSIPKSFNISGHVKGSESGIFPAKTNLGTKIISINLLLENATDPVLWRGPVISGVLKQFYTDVLWGELDYLLIDMPPGTADTALTIFQSLPVDYAIIVTSPQDLVSMIVEKAIKMAEMMHITVIGAVQNFSYVVCDNCDHIIKLFGNNENSNLSIPILDRIPFDKKLSSAIDKGMIELVENTYISSTVKKLTEE
ncbi:MAG: Mrp/NBP35 family ATP-binding protein [Clostridia bacterium]|jgi:Mrp family chromosome partitioning ATPase|nr:Mrp/NBP35 family ATP-binding protein [Clostridiaceae bacterium]HQM97246.1 Mrp/NBP35 family ATP-binding protein [Clostridia bacterium]